MTATGTSAGATPVPVVELHDASLLYTLRSDRSGSLKEAVVRGWRRRQPPRVVRAVDGLSLEVLPGEMLALIGHNGAGKSSLMKLMARVLSPTTGLVVTRGRVAPMIELGAGFNQELTGRENVVLYGTLLGNDPRHMRDRADEIAAWAEVTDFLDQPLRTYSSGMVARLAFAVAVHTPPHVLLVDEVLSVGDEQFQRKCAARMGELRERGTAVVLVSHDLDLVAKTASRAVWLDHGRVLAHGDPVEVVAALRAGVHA